MRQVGEQVHFCSSLDADMLATFHRSVLSVGMMDCVITFQCLHWAGILDIQLPVKTSAAGEHPGHCPHPHLDDCVGFYHFFFSFFLALLL